MCWRGVSTFHSIRMWLPVLWQRKLVILLVDWCFHFLLFLFCSSSCGPIHEDWWLGKIAFVWTPNKWTCKRFFLINVYYDSWEVHLTLVHLCFLRTTSPMLVYIFLFPRNFYKFFCKWSLSFHALHSFFPSKCLEEVSCIAVFIMSYGSIVLSFQHFLGYAMNSLRIYPKSC